MQNQNNLQTIEWQRGMTMSSFIGVLMIIVLLSTVAIKLVPVYIEHFSVTSSLNNLALEGKSGKESKASIRNRLLRQFSINNIDLNRDVITVKSMRNKDLVTVAYEVRKPLFGNIDLVVSFSDSIEF